VTVPRRRLTRFLHIERPRAGGDGSAPGAPAAGGRFDAVEQPKAGPEPRAATGARLERFEPAPAAAPRLELAETGAGARPFTRCMACGMDHGLHAGVCANCGARLDTPEQHAFNERLWAERQAEAARERAAGETFRAEQERAAAEEARARRALAETLAREAGDAERRRLGITTGGWRPVGAALLELVPEAWRLRAALAAGAFLVALLAGGLLARSGGTVVLAVLLGILLVVPRGSGDG
jgi:hypothetical protein